MSDENDFDALAALLPFYVNGTLAADQRAKVDTALARVPELRAELAEVVAVAALVKQGGDEWGGGESVAPAARLDRLMSRIAQEPTRLSTAALQAAPAASPPDFAGSASNNVRRLPLRQRIFQPPYSMALAAGLAAVSVVQGGLLLTRQATNDDRYVSLSGPERTTSSTGMFTLRLQQDARWGDVAAFLEGQDLRVIAGPQDGMIEVAPNAPLSPAQVDALEQGLRDSPLLAFVGRGS